MKKSVQKKKQPKRVNRSRKPRGFLKAPIQIKVIGVGGGGGNAISRMSKDFSRGVDLVAVNTDIQDLEHCQAKHKINIGRNLTKGMGAGMNPELGRQAAEENRLDLTEMLEGSDLVFLTAGMGGGTGTGATPVIADIAKELGALTVAVVTKPFAFEGSQRIKIAEEGVLKLKDKVDALIIIPNDRIFEVIGSDTSILKAFLKIDEVLKNTVLGITEIISSAGLVNVDFADVRTIMENTGLALIGVGQAAGKDRAIKAAEQAINSPLLEFSIEGAKGVLFAVAGGRDLKMIEINEAAKLVTENIDPGARIIFGAYLDNKLKSGQIKITLIAAGFNGFLKDREPFTLFPSLKTNELPSKKGEEKEEATNQKIKTKKEDVAGRPTVKEDSILEIPAFLRRRKR